MKSLLAFSSLEMEVNTNITKPEQKHKQAQIV
jgi:hypothetical protein